MRKYYKPSNVRKRNSTLELPSQVSPWEVLSLFLQENADLLLPDILPFLEEAASLESPKTYYAAVELLEAHPQMIDGSLPVSQFYANRQACTLLKKYPFESSDFDTDTRAVAIEKWKQAEDQCRETNVRLRGLSPADLPKWVERARSLIAKVLQDLSPELIMQIITSGKHGPGSTLSNTGNKVTAYYKFADLPYSCTKEALPYAYAAISSDPKWIDYLESTGRRQVIPLPGSSQATKELELLRCCVIEMNSDKITFVPKDCRTDRPIAVGASLNVFLQLGVKTYMEERMKKFGVDLTSQDKNRKYAYLGSKFCMNGYTPNPSQFSTIDLSSASDTISTELVELLLPWDWVAFLDDLRHKSGTLDGSTYSYEKFSAMGNGFTFPLESLLFWAISVASVQVEGLQCTPNDFAVYGDDIIVRYNVSPFVTSALEWAGFSINAEKSFLSGHFKESCGEDFYRGHNVRPFYLKRRVKRYADIYYILNWISAKCINSDYRTIYNSTFRAMVEKIPIKQLNFGPIDFNSESYIATPLSLMNTCGLRPWCTPSEKGALIRSGILSPDDADVSSAYTVCTLPTANPYRANQRITYMQSLRSLPEPSQEQFAPDWTKALPQEKDGRFAYRRNSVKHVVRIAPVLNWDGGYSRHQLYRSPVSFSIERLWVT